MTSSEQTALSAVELRQLQSREVAASKSSAFAGTMTVLLDSGYRVQTADLESGLITAAAPTSERLRLDPGGLARASQGGVASAYVEELSPNASRVRITFSTVTSATGQLGTTGEKAVLDPAIYGSFFGQLEQELRLRNAAKASVESGLAEMTSPAAGRGENGEVSPQPPAPEPSPTDEPVDTPPPVETGSDQDGDP